MDANHTQAKAGVVARGALWISVAKLTFIVSSSLLQFVLPSLLGGPLAWGLLATAMATLAIVTNTLVSASVQTASFATAHGYPAPRLAIPALLLGACIATGFSVLAPWLAGDPRVVTLVRAGAVVLFAYAIYATQIGILNGRQNYSAQALFDGFFSGLRLLCMAGCTWLGLYLYQQREPLYAMVGFAAASWIAAILASAVVARERQVNTETRSIPFASIARFFAPIALYQACLNVLLQGDVPLMSLLLQQQHGIDVAAEQIGLYRVAQAYAMVPYQLILALALALFPALARAAKDNDVEAARKHIEGAMHFAWVFLWSLAAPIAGARDGVVSFIHGPLYRAGAQALLLLAPAQVCFAIFVLCATVLAGAGMPRKSLLAAAIGVLVLLAGFFLGFTRFADAPLIAAAGCSLLASGIAAAVSGAAVFRRFAVFLPLRVASKTLLAAGLAFAASNFAQGWMVANRVGTVAAVGAGFVVYLASTWQMRLIPQLRAGGSAKSA